MSDTGKRIPSLSEVKDIFRDTYNFYLKWRGINNADAWPQLIEEAEQLNRKYQCDLCQRMLVELVEIIEAEFMEKG
jgi:hypothetical protein